MPAYIIKDRSEDSDRAMELQEDGTILPHGQSSPASSPAVFNSMFKAQMECNKLSVIEPGYDWCVSPVDGE